MPAYNFKRNCKVYLVQGSKRYKIDVYPDLSFSQTFDEKAVPVKTLHDQNAMFENAVINKANPADFTFTVMLPKENDFTVLGDWLTKAGLSETLATYDIYVDTGVDIFKIRRCVAERATIQIVRDRIVTVSISGTGSQLTRFGISGTTIPGTLQTRDVSPTGIIIRRLAIDLAGANLPSIASVTVELSNEVQWVEYTNLHQSLYVTSASDSQYPEVFVVSKKVLSGTIVQYVTDVSRDNLQTWSTSSSLRIRVGDSFTYYLDIDIPAVVYTNRLQVDEAFTQGYDFRMVSNPSSVSDVLKYNL